MIGLFGGTFDPPHMGHKSFGVAAIEEIGLELLYIVPNDSPDYKKTNATMEQRYMMLKLLFYNVAKAKPALFEQGNSYTCDTVAKILKKDNIDKIVLIIGSDLTKDIFSWNNVEYLKEHCVLAISQRVGYEIPTSIDWPEFFVLKTKIPEISSTETRIALSKKKEVKKYLHKDVLEYIQTKGLYAEK